MNVSTRATPVTADIAGEVLIVLGEFGEYTFLVRQKKQRVPTRRRE